MWSIFTGVGVLFGVVVVHDAVAVSSGSMFVVSFDSFVIVIVVSIVSGWSLVDGIMWSPSIGLSAVGGW